MKRYSTINRKLKGEMKAQCVNLVGQGWSDQQIANQLGISRFTIRQWKLKDERFKLAYDKSKEFYAKSSIEESLWLLASGAVETEHIESYVTQGEDGQARSITVKTKRKAPSEKALLALANKYSSGEFTNDSTNNTLSIKITQRDRSLTTEERIRLLESEASDSTITCDFKHLGELSGIDAVGLESTSNALHETQSANRRSAPLLEDEE